MIYAYRCTKGHPSEMNFPMGQAAPFIECQHCEYGTLARRDYGSVQIKGDDPFRQAWLSPKTQKALEQQNRRMDPLAPKDKFEKRHIERATGRNYIGDDASSLRPEVQRAIRTHEDKQKQREVQW